MIASTRPLFDHVALAVEDACASGQVLERELGGVPVGGGDAPGFRSYQWLFAGGMRVELLEPFRVEENDFVRRFLDDGGPGAHHLTFRVADIRAVVEQLEGDGFPLLYVRTSNPDWMEGFLHPRTAFGTVVQVVQYPGSAAAAPAAASEAMSLSVVELVVRDVDAALRLYAGVLGGVAGSAGERGRWGLPDGAALLTWPGTGALALVPAGDRAARRGGIRRLLAAGPSSPEPAAPAPGAGPAATEVDGRQVLAHPLLGTPIHLLPQA